MKQSHLLIMGSVFSVALAMTACKDDSSGRTLRVAGKGQPSPQAPGADSKFVKKTGKAPADQCYNEICGDTTTGSIEAILTAAETGTPQQQDYYNKTILPLLTKKLEGSQKIAQQKLERLEAAEKNFGTVKLSSAQQMLIKTYLLLQSSDLLDKAVLDEANKAVAAADFQKAYETFKTSKGDSYIKALHADKSTEEAIQLEVEFMSKSRDKLNTALASSPDMSIHSQIFEKAKKKETLTQSELEHFTNLSYTTHYFEFFIFGDGSEFVDKKMELKADVLEKVYASSKIKESLKEKATAATQDDATKSCEKKVYQVLNLYPQPKELEAFKALAEIVRKEAAGLMTSQDPAHDKINNVKINLPSSADEVMKTWAEALTAAAAASGDTANESEKMLKYDDAGIYTLAIIHTLNDSKLNTNRAKAPSCGEIASLSITEKTSTADNSLEVSWLAVKKPKLGMSILAHQLGHIAAQSSNSFASQQTCLKEKASEQTLGEDFADWFAAKTAAQVDKNEHQKADNLGCFLAASDKTLSFKSDNATKGSSSNLFRALQIAALTGKKVPATCSTQAKQESSKADQVCQ